MSHLDDYCIAANHYDFGVIFTFFVHYYAITIIIGKIMLFDRIAFNFFLPNQLLRLNL